MQLGVQQIPRMAGVAAEAERRHQVVRGDARHRALPIVPAPTTTTLVMV